MSHHYQKREVSAGETKSKNLEKNRQKPRKSRAIPEHLHEYCHDAENLRNNALPPDPSPL